ncbi:hypothetical protein Droror1_Dr00011952 [Drosera rotundifolia]
MVRSWVKSLIFLLLDMMCMPKFTWPMVDEIEPLALVKKYALNQTLTTVRKVTTKELSDMHRLIHIFYFIFLIKCLIPRGSKKIEATALDMILMELLLDKKQINLSVLVIKHMQYLASPRSHELPYGVWLTKTFMHFKVLDLKEDSAKIIVSDRILELHFVPFPANAQLKEEEKKVVELTKKLNIVKF